MSIYCVYGCGLLAEYQDKKIVLVVKNRKMGRVVKWQTQRT